VSRVGEAPATIAPTDRSSRRVLIVSPGFGRGLNPQQAKLVDEAGYAAVFWCWEGLPIPDRGSPVQQQHLDIIKAAIDQVRPDVVACASKGGAYMLGLWALAYWRGPSLLLNAHPTCAGLYEGVPTVICHGSNDELFQQPRSRLEDIVATGAPNRCFLYYTGNSGRLPTGQFTRVGDRHSMESILANDCLPRLLDAVMSPKGLRCISCDPSAIASRARASTRNAGSGTVHLCCASFGPPPAAKAATTRRSSMCRLEARSSSG